MIKTTLSALFILLFASLANAQMYYGEQRQGEFGLAIGAGHYFWRPQHTRFVKSSEIFGWRILYQTIQQLCWRKAGCELCFFGLFRYL